MSIYQRAFKFGNVESVEIDINPGFSTTLVRGYDASGEELETDGEFKMAVEAEFSDLFE